MYAAELGVGLIRITDRHLAPAMTAALTAESFVLTDDGLSREWAYTAMSRGRLSNHLYVAAEPDDVFVAPLGVVGVRLGGLAGCIVRVGGGWRAAVAVG